jgi:type II secretory pathway pseudopilin PulG
MIKLKNQGFSSLEALVSLFLVATVFSMTLPSLKTEILFRKSTEQKSVVTNLKHQIISELNYAFNAQGQYQDIPHYLVHNPGQINFIDGNSHPVTYGSSDLQPSPNSNAVTFLKHKPEIRFQIIKRLDSDLNFELCNFYSSLPNGNTGFKDWLAISIEGIVQISGSLKRITNSNCPGGKQYQGEFEISLQQMFSGTNSLFKSFFPTPNLLELAKNSTLILPVTEIYTLYVDNQNNLRRLSHQSTENQPVIRNLKSMLIQESIITDQSNRISILVTGLNNDQSFEIPQVILTEPNKLEILGNVLF